MALLSDDTPLLSPREMEKTEGIRLRVRAKRLQEMGARIHLISSERAWNVQWEQRGSHSTAAPLVLPEGAVNFKY